MEKIIKKYIDLLHDLYEINKELLFVILLFLFFYIFCIEPRSDRLVYLIISIIAIQIVLITELDDMKKKE
jgi:hypothetical protein